MHVIIFVNSRITDHLLVNNVFQKKRARKYAIWKDYSFRKCNNVVPKSTVFPYPQ